MEGMNQTDELISKLMTRSIENMNDRAKENPQLYSKMNGSDVEELSYSSIQEVAPSIPFNPERICLISGHTFPDIIINDTTYGVEIKSTQKDAWTSTGSSIVESTRYEGIERIFMLFGKLGGQPEFCCKPYQLCLSSIAVTHSPRYLIDMNLSEKDTIFSKLNTEYEDFRVLSENEKVSFLRKYYLAQAKKRKNESLLKNKMPWWIGEQNGVNMNFYNDLSSSAKLSLMPRLFAIFPILFNSNPDKRFKAVAIWLCDRYSLLCYNMRDSFTAGGQIISYNGKELDKKQRFPAIIGKLIKHLDDIKKLLRNPDEELLMDIKNFWDFEYNEKKLLESWTKALKKEFSLNKNLKFIDIQGIIEAGTVPFK